MVLKPIWTEYKFFTGSVSSVNSVNEGFNIDDKRTKVDKNLIGKKGSFNEFKVNNISKIESLEFGRKQKCRHLQTNSRTRDEYAYMFHLLEALSYRISLASQLSYVLEETSGEHEQQESYSFTIHKVKIKSGHKINNIFFPSYNKER